ncbi:deoxyuridine 5'-triphosphate nucleotidohydrolase [Aeromonas phage Ah1]|uniref:dUTP diphosphatase n=1 Tax=Aeromonas phage Ah1 TaxID=2053701 RepID=A0A2H4YEF7_9CAUD|nr:dUTPase [Aeromonas phage Ah1]AUE22552.1 deoxyuridine 5'-triphosphate nucleotidohydrolase [Aeromonas phage Ah1]UYD60063.1 deoxyuridine 5'-triphosphate nucleotidohydrolase [Aeromonas phage avDM12-TAAL]
MNVIPVIRLPHYLPEWELPAFKSAEAAGIDLRAAIGETVVLKPGEDIVIPSGLKMDIGALQLANVFLDIGVYGCILPRSGLGFKHYVRLANTAGVIDSDYHGEIMIKLRNEGTDDLAIVPGDRVVQMVFHLYVKGFELKEVSEFSRNTERGESGFGSSGVK